MKISNQQIMTLIQIANNFKNIIVSIGANQSLPKDLVDQHKFINIVLEEINNQQSDELKEAE